MCKFESSQKDERGGHLADSSKSYRKIEALTRNKNANSELGSACAVVAAVFLLVMGNRKHERQIRALDTKITKSLILLVILR